MSVATEIERLQTDRNTIRDKLIELGLAESTANLTTLAVAIEDIINQGAVQVEILEGTSYTIPAGYHNGSGTVKALTDVTGEAEKYKVQTKTVTPTKNQQSITPDTGYYALGAVTVNAIPEAYQNVSSVTAAAGDVLVGKVFVTKSGAVTTGTMPNNGAVSQTLSGTTVSYTIPAGFHNGSGKVTIVLEEASVTPTKETQTVTPSTGKVLSKVTVNPIPKQFADTTDATAAAADILTTKTAYIYETQNGTKVAKKVTGTMPNNGTVSSVLSVETKQYKIPAGYHNGSGTIRVLSAGEITVDPPENGMQAYYTSVVVEGEGAGNKEFYEGVWVNPIPAKYANTTDATAVAADMLADKTAYVYDSTTKAAKKITGTIPNNGTFDTYITTKIPNLKVPKGYYSADSYARIRCEEKTGSTAITPTTATQTVEPSDGYVLSKVVVNPIPSNYITTGDATAVAADILSGKTAYIKGSKVTGSMTNLGDKDYIINPLETYGKTVAANGYVGMVYVGITEDLENALKEI